MPDTTTNAASAELESPEPEAANAVAPEPAAAEPAEDLDDVPTVAMLAPRAGPLRLSHRVYGQAC